MIEFNVHMLYFSPAPPLSDFSVENWCQDNFLNHMSLKTAEATRSELRDILNRIELPISAPSFGSKANTFNIKKSLLSGFFMQVSQEKCGIPCQENVKCQLSSLGKIQYWSV